MSEDAVLKFHRFPAPESGIPHLSQLLRVPPQPLQILLLHLDVAAVVSPGLGLRLTLGPRLPLEDVDLQGRK